MKKKLIVIYNPFSGGNKSINLKEIFSKNINQNAFDYEIWPTKNANDLQLFVDKAIAIKPDIVVAAGGDGTINQIAEKLKNTNIALGFIPLGSGNGLARHFKIPLNIELAIQSLDKLKTKDIDTIWLNNHCIVNVGGVGFDAHVSSQFANLVNRGFWGYFKLIINNFWYKRQFYELFMDEKLVWSGKAFMINIANATQWGNNIIVHKGALPDDGLINILILKRFEFFQLPVLVNQLLKGTLYKNKNTITFVGTKFLLKREKEAFVHVDGEPISLGKEINIKIEPLSLKILSNE